MPHACSQRCPFRTGGSLRDVLDADVSGLDAPGKPDPAIFLEAARRLGRAPDECLVVEDAPAGVAAARRGGMACVAVDRNGDAAALKDEGAGLVLDRLDRLELAGAAPSARRTSLGQRPPAASTPAAGSTRS